MGCSLATMAPAIPTGSPIEALFRPPTRSGDCLRENYTELELLPGLTIENVWTTGVMWEDFHRFLRDNVVWMAINVFVFLRGSYVGEDMMVLKLGGIGAGLYVSALEDTAAAVATATCDFLVRLLATCEHHDVIIAGRQSNTVLLTPISGAGLSLFFQESRSCFRQVVICNMAFSADQCCALATMSRLDVGVVLSYCGLSNDAAGAFVECLQSDRGQVKLFDCNIDIPILARALTGNSRVTSLKPGYDRTNDSSMAILVAALANNRGPVHLDVYGCSISDDNLIVLCESLMTHPTLTNLDLRDTRVRIVEATDG
jgi:hypothetical protein